MAGFSGGFIKGALVSALAVSGLAIAVPLDPTDPGNKTQVDVPTPSGSGFNVGRSDTDPVLPNTDQSLGVPTAPTSEVVPRDTVSSAPSADTSSTGRPNASGNFVAMPGVELGGEVELALALPKPETAPIKRPAALGVPMPTIDNPVIAIPTNRLPSIAPPILEVQNPTAAPSEDVAVLTPPAPEVQDQVEVQDGSALLRNRVEFTNPDGKPLFSIILIDVGAKGLDRGALTTFSFPISFAVDPSTENAAAAAAEFKAGGFEVVALAPSGAAGLGRATDAAELETQLSNYLATTPSAVALMSGENQAFLRAAPQLDQVIASLKTSGRGMLSYDQGLNTADQKAQKAGVKSATIFRLIDGENESATVIKRYLDRAVLEAGKDGQVVMVGHSYPETVTALFSWALSAKSATITLAPISAVLLAR